MALYRTGSGRQYNCTESQEQWRANCEELAVVGWLYSTQALGCTALSHLQGHSAWAIQPEILICHKPYWFGHRYITDIRSQLSMKCFGHTQWTKPICHTPLIHQLRTLHWCYTTLSHVVTPTCSRKQVSIHIYNSTAVNLNQLWALNTGQLLQMDVTGAVWITILAQRMRHESQYSLQICARSVQGIYCTRSVSATTVSVWCQIKLKRRIVMMLYGF